jgi:hypothetical protein
VQAELIGEEVFRLGVMLKGRFHDSFSCPPVSWLPKPSSFAGCGTK